MPVKHNSLLNIKLTVFQAMQVLILHSNANFTSNVKYVHGIITCFFVVFYCITWRTCSDCQTDSRWYYNIILFYS